MEYADGGDLSGTIKKYIAEKKKIDEDSIWIWFLQIVSAIKHIHSKKILHRDIKSQNIFLTKRGEVKLGDFGISKVLENTMDYAKTSLGTPYFLSPEICSGNKYNFKTDIWMLGCVLYELTCLKKPFEGDNFHVKIMKLIYNLFFYNFF
jgi:NIMA (never in mitosis gene a)-related kinase